MCPECSEDVQYAPSEEEVCKAMHNIVMTQFSANIDGQTLPGIFIHNRQ